MPDLDDPELYDDEGDEELLRFAADADAAASGASGREHPMVPVPAEGDPDIEILCPFCREHLVVRRSDIEANVECHRCRKVFCLAAMKRAKAEKAASAKKKRRARLDLARRRREERVDRARARRKELLARAPTPRRGSGSGSGVRYVPQRQGSSFGQGFGQGVGLVFGVVAASILLCGLLYGLGRYRSGPSTCVFCSGRGVIDCVVCVAGVSDCVMCVDGKIRGRRCEHCGGRGTHACTFCRSGAIPCTVCDGDGRL